MDTSGWTGVAGEREVKFCVKLGAGLTENLHVSVSLKPNCNFEGANVI